MKVTIGHILEAQKMRASGMHWSKIGQHFGFSLNTMRRYLHPGEYEKHQAANLRYKTKRKRRQAGYKPPDPEAAAWTQKRARMRREAREETGLAGEALLAVYAREGLLTAKEERERCLPFMSTSKPDQTSI